MGVPPRSSDKGQRSSGTRLDLRSNRSSGDKRQRETERETREEVVYKEERKLFSSLSDIAAINKVMEQTREACSVELAHVKLAHHLFKHRRDMTFS